jgi:hypothetical protein
MNWKQSYSFLSLATLALSFPLATPFAHAQHWIQPTPEELSMTSQPEVPGAAAVYLYREQTTDDHLHSFSTYVRLKVLSERGKEYGNVELPFSKREDGAGMSVENIEGRTIHPDGTIIPFSGKPYQKLIEKTKDAKYMAKVFSLPEVEVGSIIEYRFNQRMDDNWFQAPQWYIQTELFTRKAHYLWRPTDKNLLSGGKHEQLTNAIAWTPILPANTTVKVTTIPGGEEKKIFEVNVENVPPAPDDEYMPPLGSLTYRVLFYYTGYRGGDDFWKGEGKYWSKEQDKFIGPGKGVQEAVSKLTAPTDTPELKLRKIYAAVMDLENTDFTREHSAVEEKSQGLGQVHNTDDILARRRGTGDQLTDLFVAMARAAGLKAYVAIVTNRDRHLFLQSHLSLSQLDDKLAIVELNGKEMYFDPGSRFCPFGHMAWKHTFAGGLRQTEKGTELIVGTPGEPFTYSRVARIADLKLNDHGVVTGIVRMTYTGSPALRWRQRALTGDPSSLQHEFQTSVERLLPAAMDVKVASIDKLDEYEQPLVVTFNVTGPIGSATGKRLLITSDIFESNAKPTFPHEKRQVAVYFSYPSLTVDAVRIAYPHYGSRVDAQARQIRLPKRGSLLLHHPVRCQQRHLP